MQWARAAAAAAPAAAAGVPATAAGLPPQRLQRPLLHFRAVRRMDPGALPQGLLVMRRFLVVAWLSGAMPPEEVDGSLAWLVTVCRPGAVVRAAFLDRAVKISREVAVVQDLGYVNWVLQMELRRMLALEAHVAFVPL